MKVSNTLIESDNVARSEFHTYTYETDSFYQARLAFYFEIVQEAAGYHAACRNCSIPELQSEHKTWVIARSHIEVNRYTIWPETIAVETWAQQPIRLHMPRIVRGVDEQGKAVFSAITQWAVIDLEHNGRPCRPGSIAERIGLPDPSDTDHYVDAHLPRRIAYDDSECTTIVTYRPHIQYLDTDSNHHVNNISYLNWILESLPSTFRDRYKVAMADVSWFRQTFDGEAITVYTGSTASDAFTADHPELLHKIVRTEENGTTIVWEGTTKWERRERFA